MLSLQQELSSTDKSSQGRKYAYVCAITVIVGATIATIGFLASQRSDANSIISFDVDCIRKHGVSADCEVTVAGADTGRIGVLAYGRPDAKDSIVSFDLDCIRDHGIRADCVVSGYDHSLYLDQGTAMILFQATQLPKLTARPRQSIRHRPSILMTKSQQKPNGGTSDSASRTLVGRRATLTGLLSSVALPPAAQAMMPKDMVPALSGLPVPGGSLLSKLLEDRVRVQPQLLLRSKLEQDFAVILMRKSYSIADEMDFYPMDKFQKDQFLFRQNEWEKYLEDMAGTRQGELSDPAYFDFISYVQYATLGAEFQDARQVFEELIDANGTSRVSTRDPALSDNKALPELHSQRVGDAVLAWIKERYTDNGPMVPGELTAAALNKNVQKILNIFQINGYMLLSELEPKSNGVKVTLTSPATLWSQQMLRKRRDPANAFEVKTILAYLRQSGVPATVATSISGTKVEHVFTWPAQLVS